MVPYRVSLNNREIPREACWNDISLFFARERALFQKREMVVSTGGESVWKVICAVLCWRQCACSLFLRMCTAGISSDAFDIFDGLAGGEFIYDMRHPSNRFFEGKLKEKENVKMYKCVL